MSYCTALDISPEPLSLEGHAFMNYFKATGPRKHFRASLNVATHIRRELVELLDQHGLYIRFGELFYTPSNRITLIHVDSEPEEYMVPDNMAKINYIGGGKGSWMHWYKPILQKPYEPTGRNKFISYQPNEVRSVGSSKLAGFNIVQTGIPHNITTTNEARYCVSLTLAIKGQPPKMIPYETLVTMLDSFSISSAASSSKSAMRSGLPSVTDNLPGI
jgi:hypothetical protein